MIEFFALALALQDANRPPQLVQVEECVAKNSIINGYLIQVCIPGITATSVGNAMDPIRQADGTYIHQMPYRADKGVTFRIRICSIDLIDYNFSSSVGAVVNLSESSEPKHCLVKGYTIPKGEITLTVRTRTKFPTLVVRSTVITAPIATLLQPPPVPPVIVPPIILILPPPPPPPVPPPVVVAPPPPPMMMR